MCLNFLVVSIFYLFLLQNNHSCNHTQLENKTRTNCTYLCVKKRDLLPISSHTDKQRKKRGLSLCIFHFSVWSEKEGSNGDEVLGSVSPRSEFRIHSVEQIAGTNLQTLLRHSSLQSTFSFFSLNASHYIINNRLLFSSPLLFKFAVQHP